MRILNKTTAKARGGKIFLIPAFHEEAAFVFEVVDVDDDEIRKGSRSQLDFCGTQDHSSTFMKSFLITASIDVATRMSAELANNYGVSFSGVEDSHSEIIGALLVLNFAEECLVVSARFRC